MNNNKQTFKQLFEASIVWTNERTFEYQTFVGALLYLNIINYQEPAQTSLKVILVWVKYKTDITHLLHCLLPLEVSFSTSSGHLTAVMSRFAFKELDYFDID